MRRDEIRIVTKEEFLTSQIFFNNLARNFLRRIRNVHLALSTPKNTRIIHTNNSKWRVRRGGGGGYFILLRGNGFFEKS